MHTELINSFYTGLASQNGEAMAACYHDEAMFEDPAFGELDTRDARDMWRMLCASGTDLQVRHTILDDSESSATVNWIADYTFSTSGRSVTNDVTATMKFQDGLIIDHRDNFDFWKWSRQALGAPGMLLGWSPMLKSKVRATTRANLDAFQASQA